MPNFQAFVIGVCACVCVSVCVLSVCAWMCVCMFLTLRSDNASSFLT